MKFTLMTAVVLCAMAVEAKTTKTPQQRKPAQVQPVVRTGPVSLTEKAPICRAIEARYQSTSWAVCGKSAKFTREKAKIKIALKTKKGPLKCNAELRPRGRFFDVTRLKCD